MDDEGPGVVVVRVTEVRLVAQEKKATDGRHFLGNASSAAELDFPPQSPSSSTRSNTANENKEKSKQEIDVLAALVGNSTPDLPSSWAEPPWPPPWNR